MQQNQITKRDGYRRYLHPMTVLSHLLMIALFASMAFGTVGCKAKKEARAAAAARAEKIAKARADLLAVINDQGSMTLEEKEEVVASIREMNLQDAEIQNLIDQAEALLAEERAAAREEEEEPVTESRGPTTNEDLSRTLRDIANASGSDANFQIREAMNLFASPDSPVLIVISESGGQVDYDEPTTIKKYLEYLKDTNNQPAQVRNLEFDANGKIKEVELIKNYNR